MNTRFGIIAGLLAVVAGCDSGQEEALFLNDARAALGCGGSQLGDCGPEDEQSGHAEERDERDADGGVEPYYRSESEHDNSGPGNSHDRDEGHDDHDADAGAGEPPTADGGVLPACDDRDYDCDHGGCEKSRHGGDCEGGDEDRSGSNSGPG